jgi:NADPH:quinone reductase-like Zn-dependent oxidoreductase
LNIPSAMRAAFVRSNGGADLIEYAELPTPVPGPTDVLVRVAAAGVNHVDLFVRSGAYQTHTPFPFVIGRDLVGSVAAVGAGVDQFSVGDRVWCNSLGHAGRQGPSAEYAVVSVERLYRLPDGADAAEAVAVLHTSGTAHIGLFREAKLKMGETVYVSGAGGGVGSAVVQLARSAGAHVIAAAAPYDHEWCRESGAHVVLDYSDPNLYSALQKAAPSGVDVWWDNSGKHDLSAALPLLRHRGRILMMAGLTATPVLPAGALYTRDASILGFAISEASISDLETAARSINGLLEAGKLVGRIGAVLPLAEAAKAHQMMEKGGIRGRIVLIP